MTMTPSPLVIHLPSVLSKMIQQEKLWVRCTLVVGMSPVTTDTQWPRVYLLPARSWGVGAST